jgi:hypothetical protein
MLTEQLEDNNMENAKKLVKLLDKVEDLKTEIRINLKEVMEKSKHIDKYSDQQ